MNNYSIYKRIYELAQKKGLSLQKLAEKAGMSTNLIYSWKNKKHPSKTSLKKLLIF
ncbi:helix-turn-helix transcriptional regulator [Lactobacillus sp. B4007]|uniref:helix-turn-helix domain-containing protein n=1 Tax=Lactobacillus sp. B4007 TaxID=2818032 RepID=UPI002B404696|nr:helix-turn-helix transcriptional regulator [Lactobacillus sp. B4007]